MSAQNVSEVSEQTWIRDVFPEWGTWLNEEIDGTTIPEKSCGLWWLGNMGVWVKSDRGTSLIVDAWVGSGKRTHAVPDMKPSHQWARMAGCRKTQPNLRLFSTVFNPFAISQLDAVLATHYHYDHIDINVVAAVLDNIAEPIPFIGPKYVVEQWVAWGVPENRCRAVRPGDVVEVKDVTIHVVESFDRTVLITDPPTREGQTPSDVVPDMDERSVNYVIETDAATIYHGADSHFSSQFAEHGKRFDIDIALLAYAENGIGIQDKMTSSDILRAAEALGTKVVIPMHWDAWTNALADPREVEALWRLRREHMAYTFHPFCWLPGGRYVYPRDRNRLEYFHDRGFDDRYSHPIDLPFKAFV